MTEPLSKFAIGAGVSLAVSIGLRAGGNFLGPLAPITTASTMLIKFDDAMREQAVADVLNANKTREGLEPNIIAIPEFNGSQGKAFLQDVVKKRGGGTAWYQTGHGRMECFWIHKRNFVPKKVGGPKESVGYVVHGDTDAEY
jgi:hypothetical protein